MLSTVSTPSILYWRDDIQKLIICDTAQPYTCIHLLCIVCSCLPVHVCACMYTPHGMLGVVSFQVCTYVFNSLSSCVQQLCSCGNCLTKSRFVFTCFCVCTVCMFVCMYVCMYVCMCMYILVCMHASH